mmetsp:Transcript_7092/g.27189  ORF Transcript_7092/g.27189 Transcript_7092/m.27189 type:complete len:396 (+) Transcript_7092:110-1297(+)|eukprot:scaffold498_cov348-Pinguiococcus_pyrenoidosus.AAC.9
MSYSDATSLLCTLRICSWEGAANDSPDLTAALLQRPSVLSSSRAGWGAASKPRTSDAGLLVHFADEVVEGKRHPTRLLRRQPRLKRRSDPVIRRDHEGFRILRRLLVRTKACSHVDARQIFRRAGAEQDALIPRQGGLEKATAALPIHLKHAPLKLSDGDDKSAGRLPGLVQCIHPRGDAGVPERKQKPHAEHRATAQELEAKIHHDGEPRRGEDQARCRHCELGLLQERRHLQHQRARVRERHAHASRLLAPNGGGGQGGALQPLLPNIFLSPLDSGRSQETKLPSAHPHKVRITRSQVESSRPVVGHKYRNYLLSGLCRKSTSPLLAPLRQLSKACRSQRVSCDNSTSLLSEYDTRRRSHSAAARFHECLPKDRPCAFGRPRSSSRTAALFHR